MLSRMVASVLLFVFFTSLFVTGIRLIASASRTITVPDDYPTIQAAINNASGGDTIFVRNGTYYENVVVNNVVSLTGENKYGTIIDGNGTGTVVRIDSNGVSVTGFTMRGSGTEGFDWVLQLMDCSYCNISDNVMSDNHQGLFLVRGWGNSFYRNTITNNYLGAFLVQMQQTTFKNNYLTNNTYPCSIYSVGAGNNIDTSNLVDGKPLYCLTNEQNSVISPAPFPDVGYLALQGSRNVTITGLTTEGISLSDCTNCRVENSTVSNSTGIYLEWASNNTISQNTIINSYYGVYAAFSSDTNTIADNAILGNGMGISIANSVDNLVFNNQIAGNGWGLGVWYPTGGNKIFHNNFINNTVQASQASLNFWDDGYPSGGNYWSDYAGNDTYSGPYQNETGKDGVGDTPYTVGHPVSKDTLIDNYPLMKPYVQPICDLNGDWKVDMKDVGIAAKAFGTSPGDPRWNPLADVNGDGKVDMRDIALIARNFGKTYR